MILFESEWALERTAARQTELTFHDMQPTNRERQAT
jgi:hypothetical protein